MTTGDSTAPIVPIRNAWLLLLYANDLARWAGSFRGEAESATSLRELLGRVLCQTAGPLLRRGGSPQFRPGDRIVPGIRGRIRVQASLPHLARSDGHTVCEIHERSLDTLRNRIVRATLVSLLGDPTCGSPDPTAGSVHDRARRMLRDLEGVSSVRLGPALFGRLQLGRSDLPWELPLAVCRMLHQLEAPSETVGDTAMAALLRDEIKFHSLFERFVRNFYRTHHPEWRQPSRTFHWWSDVRGTPEPEIHPMLPSMHADIVLARAGDPSRRIVIDTKFYRHTLARWWGKEQFHSGNLYQLYAYLQTQAHRGPEFQRAEGILLYPTIQREVDETFQVHDHRIRVRTLNLAGDWADVEARLRDLLAPVGHQPSAVGAAAPGPATALLPGH